MMLEIKTVKKCKPDDAYGTFAITGPERAIITISTTRNRTISDYAATLLHELLHCYIALLKSNGFKVGAKKEHVWIEACEEVITKLMAKIMPRRRK